MANSTEELYNSLTPTQRADIARQFQEQFHQSGNDSTAKKFANVDPNSVSGKQLADMHKHAADNHPGILGTIRNHPMLAAALGAIGAYELDKHFGKK